MPVAIRRAIARGSDEAERRGQQSARSDRSFSEALDVISVSPVPYGPFGQEQRYGGRSGRVNGFVHELRRGMGQSIHELSTVVDCAWTARWITRVDVDGTRVLDHALPAIGQDAIWTSPTIPMM
jgi:hypothetical protein